MASLGKSSSHQDLYQQYKPSYKSTDVKQNSYISNVSQRPMSSSIQRPQNEPESKLRPQSSNPRRLSFSLHDISKPWVADNTNLINGFYSVSAETNFAISWHFSGASTWRRGAQVSAHNVRSNYEKRYLNKKLGGGERSAKITILQME